MVTKCLLERFRQCLREWRTANGANVTVTFALATIPMVGFVGSAVDYSRANSIKVAMQAATDSTALMLSKEVIGLSSDQIATKANSYFSALFNRPEVTGVTVTTSYTTEGGSQIALAVDGLLNTDFMRIMGFSSLHVGAKATIKWGNSRLRVALVLDNTGSMSSSGKMDALKTATAGLLTQLKNAATNNGDVYVSIIPFVKDVNAGAGNYNATWIDWTSWDSNNGTCSNYSSWHEPKTRSSCLNNDGTWAADNHNTWNGCVTDRGNSGSPSTDNYDTNVAAPTTSITATLFAAEQYSSCPQAVMPLSYDWLAMSNLVSSMAPAGNTNQAIGLAHGWMSLVGGGPYPPPPLMDLNYKYSQVIILLTDGLNTQDRWYTSQSSIDTRQQMTCNNVKAAGITLYTVQVNTDGDPTSALLQNCASSSDKFFLLTSANQMVATFQQIGTNLSNLRIAN
jgi:Flp pilus assembly protein TadG